MSSISIFSFFIFCLYFFSCLIFLKIVILIQTFLKIHESKIEDIFKFVIKDMLICEWSKMEEEGEFKLENIQDKWEEMEKMLKDMPEYHINTVIEQFYDKLPRVFIDGHSLVKVSLTRNYINCTQYSSRTGLTFNGCYELKNKQLKEVRGIYYVSANPIWSIGSRRKVTRDLNQIEEIIVNEYQNIFNYLHIPENSRLLISYDNYSISIFDKFVKGKTLKFPLKGEQGNLKVIWVPKIPFPLNYEKVQKLQIYNHNVEFEKEVIRFEITAFGGIGELIYNFNDLPIYAKLNSPDHEPLEITLGKYEVYLLTHPKPRKQAQD